MSRAENARTHTHVHTPTHVQTHHAHTPHSHAHTLTHIHTHMHAHILTQVTHSHTCAQMLTYTRAHMCTHMYTHPTHKHTMHTLPTAMHALTVIYTLTYMHTSAHIHTHMCTCTHAQYSWSFAETALLGWGWASFKAASLSGLGADAPSGTHLAACWGLFPPVCSRHGAARFPRKGGSGSEDRETPPWVQTLALCFRRTRLLPTRRSAPASDLSLCS